MRVERSAIRFAVVMGNRRGIIEMRFAIKGLACNDRS